jgi:hypothetical protein
MWKWIAKKIRNAQVDEDCAVSETYSPERSTEERVTVRLDKAIGGHIASVNKYNKRSDRYTENTYIIREDDNLEEALTAVFVQEKISQ